MASIPVAVNLVYGSVTTTTRVRLDPAHWTADDARRFVWDVWRLLVAAGGESLQLRELQPHGMFRLEFIADTGAAVTDPIRLSAEALRWLETVTFRLPADDRTH